jgi:very-short-patch-repair endonuclease
MLSRAKFKEYIVSSIEFSDVDISGSTSDGSRFFRQFLEYAQSISSGNYDAIKYIFDTTNPSQDQFDSPFEEQVCTQLRQLGYTVETQVGVRGYRIDMAVYDNELGRYIAGIECDGATYHSREDVREHDVIRQRFLESRGWTILRIWSTNWWKNSNSELSRIDSKLKELRELLLSVKQDIVEDIQESRAVVQIEDTNNTGLEDAELDTPNISDSQKLNISLLDKSDITGTKPVAVIIDDCFYDVKSWWDILSTLLIHVLKKDSTITDAEIIPVVGSLKANMSECRKPQQLLWGRNLYLERNQSSIGAFTGIKQVLNKYNCKVEVVMK